MPINIKFPIGIIGTDTSDANVQSTDVLLDKIAYNNIGKIVGTIPIKEMATYVPSTTDQVISGNQYLNGPQTILGDADLISSNIVQGVSIFGVDGSATTTGYDTSDATVKAENLLGSVTAYGSTGKITGTMRSKTSQTYTPTTTDQTIDSGQYISEVQTILGDVDLVSTNIRSGVNIFGVEGATNVIDTTEVDNPASNANLLTGRVAFVNGRKITGSIPSLDAATYTPTITNQVIVGQQFLQGSQTILGDTNLVADNIKNGVSIFGIEGTYSGGSTIVRTTLFENITDAVNTYGPIIYMNTNGVGGGTTESLSSITALIAKNGKYSDLISSNNNNEFRISTNSLGWGSLQHIVNITPIDLTGSRILWFLLKVSTSEAKTVTIKLVQATGTGDTLANNILANASVNGSYIDISKYVPSTNRNYIEMLLRTDISAYTGNYYLYFETMSDNSSPYFQNISSMVEH